MKVWVNADEWYPVYTAKDVAEVEDWRLKYGRVVELDAKDLADFQRILEEFQNWRERLGDLYDDAEDPRL